MQILLNFLILPVNLGLKPKGRILPVLRIAAAQGEADFGPEIIIPQDQAAVRKGLILPEIRLFFSNACSSR
jgi:hypothetical protein